MGQINKHIAVDSMILIYFLEGHKKFTDLVKDHMKKAEQITFSSFGMAEILVGLENPHLKKEKILFLSFLETHPKLKVIDFTKNTAFIFAQLRAKYPQIKAPDIIHLATAIQAQADYFLTNDKKLQCVKEIPVRLLA